MHLGVLLKRTAIVAVGVENARLALNLIFCRRGHVEEGRLDLVEAISDVAAADLHPDVIDALEQVDLAVVELIDHRLASSRIESKPLAMS